MNGTVSFALGLLRGEGETAFGAVDQSPSSESLQGRRERLEYEIIRVCRRADSLANIARAGTGADEKRERSLFFESRESAACFVAP